MSDKMTKINVIVNHLKAKNQTENKELGKQNQHSQQMLDRDSFELVRIHAYKSSGLGKKPVPKFVRKLVAKTMLHRAWLQGHTGSFLVSVLDRS